MLSLKRKLSSELRNAFENKSYKNYRVIIHCTTMIESIEKKAKHMEARS
jgi:serine protease AprX